MSLWPDSHYQGGHGSSRWAKDLMWPCLLVAEVLIYSSYGIFVNLSRIDGNVTYQSSSMWLSIEVIKLLLALTCGWHEIVSQGLKFSHTRNILSFGIPAFCYCVNNNLSVFMQDEMDPATFQVLCNMKIASTAILYRIIIKRKLSLLQWFSLGLLMFAGGLSSYNGLREQSRLLSEIHLTTKGILMVAVYCSVSGFAGVYTEYILKKDAKVPLSLQNFYMYSFGVILNGFLMLYQSNALPAFHGFTKYTWIAVFLQAVNGLVMSFIMKHSSNITRLFVISSAVPVAAVLSIFVFHLNPGFELFFVIFLVVLALFIYNTSPVRKPVPPEKHIL